MVPPETGGPPRLPLSGFSSRGLPCAFLGILVAEHKRDGPTTCFTFLGIEVDTIAGQLRLPADKLDRLQTLLREWGDRKVCQWRELESLVTHVQGRPVRPNLPTKNAGCGTWHSYQWFQLCWDEADYHGKETAAHCPGLNDLGQALGRFMRALPMRQPGSGGLPAVSHEQRQLLHAYAENFGLRGGPTHILLASRWLVR